MMERVSEDEVRQHGWNSPVHDNPTANARITTDQLNQIGLLLLDIRDRLDVLAERPEVTP